MPFSAPKLISHFLSGKAALTRIAYSKDLDDFRLFLRADSVEFAIMRLLGGGHGGGQEILARYIDDMKRRRDLGSATINRRLATLRSLGKESRILGMVPWVLEARNVRHEPVRDSRGPGVSNIIKLLNHLAAIPQDKAALRDTAIIRLLTDQAMRRGAICNLNRADFRTETSEVMTLEKGRRSKRPRILSVAAARAMRSWLAVRGSQSGAIFINFDTIHVTKTGARLTGSALYAMLAKRSAEAGIEGRIRPHGIRHTSAELAAEEGAKVGYGLDRIIEHTGHSEVRTLEIYLDKTKSVQKELAEAVSSRLRT